MSGYCIYDVWATIIHDHAQGYQLELDELWHHVMRFMHQFVECASEFFHFFRGPLRLANAKLMALICLSTH